MSKAIATLTEFTEALEISFQRGECPRDRLFMFERCNYGDMLEVDNPELTDEEVLKAPIVYLLMTTVYVLAGRSEYVSTWGWEPKEHRKGRVCFYDTDYDRLLETGAKWMIDHHDTIAPEYIHKSYGVSSIKPIKCEPIGTIKHYTTTEGFEEGNLERKRGW